MPDAATSAPAAIPTQEEIAAKKKRQALLGGTTLCVVLGIVFFGTPLAMVACAVAAVLWWGRPLGMAAMFGLALSAAWWANPRPAVAVDPNERFLGKRDKASLLASGEADAPRGGATASLAPTGPTTVAPAAGYTVVDVKDGGRIHGFVRVETEKAVWQVEHFKDQAKGCGEKAPTQRMAYGENRGLGNAVVYLRSIGKGKAWTPSMSVEERAAVIDQRRCDYAPHVQWVRTETQIVVENSDMAEHNIHGYRETVADTQFNFASPPGQKKADVAAAFLEKPAVYLVKCDIHPWMNAYVHVVTHPYVEVTSARAEAGRAAGEYLLADVPPGPYTLVCWHEGLGETAVGHPPQSFTYPPDFRETVTVTVQAGETVEVPAFVVPFPR